MAYNSLSLAEKLNQKTVRQGECLVWTGQKDRRGYGFLRLDGRLKRAHRLAYELHIGPIPKGAVLRHSCDNPACIEVAHLQPGTQLQNVADMFSRGRANKATGAKHPKAKLTEEQVAEIRRRYVPRSYGRGPASLAKEFGVSKQAIQAILKGKTWRTDDGGAKP